jgi:hypothetical protein
MSHGGSGEPERVISLDGMTADRNDMRCSFLRIASGLAGFASPPCPEQSFGLVSVFAAV